MGRPRPAAPWFIANKLELSRGAADQMMGGEAAGGGSATAERRKQAGSDRADSTKQDATSWNFVRKADQASAACTCGRRLPAPPLSTGSLTALQLLGADSSCSPCHCRLQSLAQMLDARGALL